MTTGKQQQEPKRLRAIVEVIAGEVMISLLPILTPIAKRFSTL